MAPKATWIQCDGCKKAMSLRQVDRDGNGRPMRWRMACENGSCLYDGKPVIFTRGHGVTVFVTRAGTTLSDSFPMHLIDEPAFFAQLGQTQVPMPNPFAAWSPTQYFVASTFTTTPVLSTQWDVNKYGPNGPLFPEWAAKAKADEDAKKEHEAMPGHLRAMRFKNGD